MDKEAKSLDIKSVLNPKVWLIITGLVHAIMGVLFELDMENETQVVVAGFFLLTTFTMLYAAFFTEGEQQARLATVIAGPIWVWFIVCSVQGYTIDYEGETFTFELSTSIPPLILWGMTALSGIIHGNFQELNK